MLEPVEIPTDLQAPDPTRCPASKPREVRYASTVDASELLKPLPPEIGARRCIEQAATALAEEFSCVADYNRDAWTHALASAGLVPFESRSSEGPLDLLQGAKVGSVHLVADDDRFQMVYLGSDSATCNGRSQYAGPGAEASLARNAAGQLVVALARPQVEAREYRECRCFPGCGMRPPASPRVALVDARLEIVGSVEIHYPAKAVYVEAVERSTCCCAP